MYHQIDRTLNSLHHIYLVIEFHPVELDLRLLSTVLLFVVKNDIETVFFSGNRLQNQGAHYTQPYIINR